MSSITIMDKFYEINKKTNPAFASLDSFLSNPDFKTEKKDKYTNIIDQRTGGTYAIPVSLSSEESIFSQYLESDKTLSEIDKFFDLIEECRIKKMPLCFSEKQYFSVKQKLTPEQISKRNELSLEFKKDDIVPEDIEVSNSCLELDFDILLSEKYEIQESFFYPLIMHTVIILCKTLDPDSRKISYFSRQDLNSDSNSSYELFVAVLRKSQREVNDKKYKKCWKESFHIKFFLKISKKHKQYIRKLMLENDAIKSLFLNLPILNPLEDIIDKGMFSAPTMLLENSKRTSNTVHKFSKLYKVSCDIKQGFPVIIPRNDFEAKKKEQLFPTSNRANAKKVKKLATYYDYNLTHELSVVYERENGLIKKPEYSPLPSLISEIKTYSERTKNNLISDKEIFKCEKKLSDITVRNFKARYIQKILDIIAQNRVIDYESWKTIVIALARESQEYKKLAEWFSMRYASSYLKEGKTQISNLFEFAKRHPKPEDSAPITCATLFFWAQKDNPEEYEKLQEGNMFMQVNKAIFESAGDLKDIRIARLVHNMFGQKFVCDEDKKALNSSLSNRVWREFVFPEDDYETGQLYKWRRESYPDSLHDYISIKFPGYLNTVMDFCNKQISDLKKNENEDTPIEPEKEAENKRKLEYFEAIKKGISLTKKKLETGSFVKAIIESCKIVFRKNFRGFETRMDKDPNYIGVVNGVLKLRPELELIQGYHNVAISKFASVSYIEYDPSNYYIKNLEKTIMEIFSGDRETYEFFMMMLASGLDGCDNNPQQFVIMHGEGAQGKTFLAELDQNVLGETKKDGYSTKMNLEWFCSDRKASGPDSAISATKGSRRIWASEVKPGETLNIAKIKELLSERITANEKNEKQDTWKVNANIFSTVNDEPKIIGRDYGTYRRILYYRFKTYFKYRNEDDFDENDPFIKECNPDIMNFWVSDVNYKTAYLSILVHWYEILKKKYNFNFKNIPHTTIRKETDEYFRRQDTVTQFIHERVIHIGKRYKDGTEVENVSMLSVVEKYIRWHNRRIGTEKYDNNKIIAEIQDHPRIKKFIRTTHYNTTLQEHRVLDVDENYENAKIPPNSDFLGFQEDIFDETPDFVKKEINKEFQEIPETPKLKEEIPEKTPKETPEIKEEIPEIKEDDKEETPEIKEDDFDFDFDELDLEGLDL